MVSRVSTYSTSNGLFNQAQRLQTAYAKVAQQSSSGLRSENYDGIAADSQQLLVLNGDLNNFLSQSSAMKAAQLRVGAVQNTLDTLGDTLNKVATFFVDVQNGINAPSAIPGFVAQATTLRDSIVSLLNSQLGGQYLFGGSVYDRAPVNISDPTYNPTAAPTTVDTNYYQGDDVLDTVRATDTQRITYGITADNPAFEQALRALQIYIAGPTNPTSVTQATDLNKAAINDLTGLKGQALAYNNILTDAISANGVTTGYLQENISGVRDVDVAQAATLMSQYETQLQASYSAFAKLLQLRLTDYLR